MSWSTPGHGMKLSDEEIWLFHHNGYVMVHEGLEPATVNRLRRVTDAQVAARRPPIVLEESPGDESSRPVRRLSKLVHRDPCYLEAALSDAITEPLSSLLGEDIELCTNRHNHLMVRPPGREKSTGTATRWSGRDRS